ncbi:hypothetical protein GPECTOR_13g613 [Gonium pectorale]|uniref:Ankyrin repeat domain-containing protein n=1 Tax=Gonium pectorale TaxID=33097 RepID=A0A150GMM6_GONPE|nr:hypothetical protein GPECTOR_13g613 [Gonium pectorale]|eukprot:KXZ51126.1 hypothetical protein GPECTOR_13g613 [Gonium pectorale]
MEARYLDVEAVSSVGASPVPNIWLPGLVERFASLLHPNEVMCTLRCADKATAEQFRGRPEFASVRLSQPVPPHAFTARWAAPGAMRDLTLAQRKKLLRLTADSGVVANMEVALEAVGFIPQSSELLALLEAPAYEGHLGLLLREAIGSSTADWQAKVEWAESQLPPTARRYSDSCSSVAAHPDAIFRLTWLLARGYPADEDVANSMLRNGNTAALELLLGRGLRPPHSATDDAARWGWLEVLKKLREYGYPLGVTVKMWLAASRDQLPVLVWAVEELGATLQDRQLSKTAAGQCGLETLAWLQQRGCPLDGAEVAQGAAMRGDLQLLQWAVQELGAPLTSPALLDAAAGVGSIELMAWLRERGCPWGGRVYSNAARAGCVAALEWLAEQGCPVPDDNGPLMEAADWGDLATLRCLARLGCPWGPASGPGAVFEACLSPHRPLLTLHLLLELGCPVDWEACTKAACDLPEQMRDWILAKAA